MKATFHERQYELAVNLELVAGSGMYFAPMQVIEENVGYDIALVPGNAAVWSLLGVTPPPVGVRTPIEFDPTLRPASGGMTFSASLFIQYKRPERMIRRSAREAGPRKSQGGSVPFFRVRLNQAQHEVLAELEARVGTDAVVRYCAPSGGFRSAARRHRGRRGRGDSSEYLGVNRVDVASRRHSGNNGGNLSS